MTCICGDEIPEKRIAAIQKYSLEPYCLKCAEHHVQPYRASQEYHPELDGKSGDASGWTLMRGERERSKPLIGPPLPEVRFARPRLNGGIANGGWR